MDDQPVETTLYSLASAPPRQPERRNDARHITLLRVGALVIGERRELCLVRNVSAGGMLIRAYSAIAPGTRLVIELKQDEPLTGTALWAADELVGISFDTPIDILSLIKAAPDSPRSRMPRLEVHCTGWVRDGAIIHRTRVVNISQGGVRVEAPNALPVAARVTVTLPGLPSEQGMVCWSDGPSSGITFNRLLPLPQLVAWLGEQQERQRATAAVR